MVTYNIFQMNMSGMVCMQKTWQINNRCSENGEWELESVCEREWEEEREFSAWAAKSRVVGEWL